MNYPTISVVIPCFNGQQKLGKCIATIREQDYPQDCIEIIVVDDKSSDDTVGTALRLGCKVVENGAHSPERGKSIGVENANGEYLFFMDDDNRLTDRQWLPTLVEAVEREGCVGGQASYFAYFREDPLANRYAALFAINDPTVFYLKKRDKLMQTEKTWTLPGEIVRETDAYWRVRFTPENLPTIGSQGFLIKKELLLKTSWKPFLCHMGTNLELVMQGHADYVMLKRPVIHEHSDTLSHFVGKLKRNISYYYEFSQYRKYKYGMNTGKMLKLGLVMGTFILPIKDSLAGWSKIHDPAWLVHPFVCFYVAFIYTLAFLKHCKTPSAAQHVG